MMGTALLHVAGRRYEIACRDGDEARLERLGAAVDAKARSAAAGMGNVNEARRLLFAALLLADELSEARRGEAQPAPPTPAEPELGDALAALADRLEALAGRLENQATPV